MSQAAVAGTAAHGQRRRPCESGQAGQARQSGLTAQGLAVWVTLPEDAACDPAVLARAAELVLGRALRCAPEAEVHFRPAAGAATSAVVETPGGEPPAPSAGSISRLAVDLAAGDARVDGERVPLTDLEFALLRCLVQNCSRTVSRQELQHCLDAFGTPGAAARSIDVYVGRVRRKLKGCRHAVVTVRSGGYRFIPGPLATVRGPAEYSI
ncbi:winged helix-turn-helix domain-containing protein [Arthrobacter sp. PM3]|uniref:winged helix-turn-helix domain-containing protein n=1 Tax=Arthrobacter sp. PM3 TaxID=2017685 RepID=UPI000E10B9F4|nr:winged helix-turn-helix domain-containing protein [Arthrobacter sp. PM3]AXJ08773.1 transcriptional regulator [Arthrobacter sp. PM3]